MTGRKGASGECDLALGVLDELTLIEHNDIPSDTAESLRVSAQLGVVDDQNIRILTIGIEPAGFRREDGGGEIGGESGGLGDPTVGHTFWANDEGAKRFGLGFSFGGALRFIRAQLEHPSKRLDGFTQTHVIGQNSAKSLLGEVRQKMVSVRLIRTEVRLQVGRKFGRLDRGDFGGPVFQAFDHALVARRQAIGFEGELQGVEPVFGGVATLEHVGYAETEAIQCFGGFFVDRRFGVNPPPTVFGQVHPFAACFEQQLDLFGVEIGVFDFQSHGEVEPVLFGVGRIVELQFHAGAQWLVQQAGNFGRELGVDVRGESGVPAQKAVGELVVHGSHPSVSPAIPHQTEAREAFARFAGAAEFELQRGFTDLAGRRRAGFGPLPTYGIAGPLFLASRVS